MNISETLQWHHKECDGISNQWCLDCLLNHLFRHQWKKTSKFRITGLCVGNPLLSWPAPCHNLKQCLIIVNWTLRNKFQWNAIWNSYSFIQENRFKDIIWKVVAILSRPQFVNFKAILVYIYISDMKIIVMTSIHDNIIDHYQKWIKYLIQYNIHWSISILMAFQWQQLKPYLIKRIPFHC